MSETPGPAHRCLRSMLSRDRRPVVGLYFLDGTRALSATTRGALELWDTEAGASAGELVGHRGRITAIAAAASGEVVASVDERGHLRVWDVAALRCALHLDYSDHDQNILQHLSLCDDGSRGLTTDGGGAAYVWDLRRGRLERTLALGFDGGVLGTALVCGGEGRAYLRLADESWVACPLEGQARPAPAPPPAAELAFRGRSPRYRAWLVDERVVLRERASGRDVATLEGHDQPVLSATVTHDGRRLLSGDAGGTMRLWALDWP